MVDVDYMRWIRLCACVWSSHIDRYHQCCHSAFNPVPFYLLQLTTWLVVYLSSAQWHVRRSALTLTITNNPWCVRL